MLLLLPYIDIVDIFRLFTMTLEMLYSHIEQRTGFITVK